MESKLQSNLPGLNKRLRKLHEIRERLEREMIDNRLAISEVEEEIKLHKNEEYWKNHPDEPELKAGDKLVINEQFQDMKIRQIGYEGASFYFKNSWALGKIVSIHQLNLDKNEVFISSTGVTSCEYKVAQSMRDSYLEMAEK